MARTLSIGDIHGCLTALDTLIGYVRPSEDDTLIFLGDFVDRGPDSRRVVERLIALTENPRVICIRGNHEIMMLGARGGRNDFRYWATFGGLETLESYSESSQNVSLEVIPDSHWSFLERTLDRGYETKSHIFVHANLHPALPLAEQSSEWIHWQPINSQSHQPHLSGKTMVCGHTQQRSGVPLVLDKAICIDTWAYGDGWLTCLDVESGDFWQANELGSTRKGLLGFREAFLDE